MTVLDDISREQHVYERAKESDIMDKTMLLTIAAVALVAAAGVYAAVTAVNDDSVTTTVTVNDGIRCTINGKAVSDGDEIKINPMDGKMDIHLESDTPGLLSYVGYWEDGDRSVDKADTVKVPLREADFTVAFDHGKFCGGLTVGMNAYGPSDNALTLRIFHDEYVRGVYWGDTRVMDGQTMTFLYGEAVLTVRTADNSTKMMYHADWSSSSGTDSKTGEFTGNTIVDIKSGFDDPASGILYITQKVE